MKQTKGTDGQAERRAEWLQPAWSVSGTGPTITSCPPLLSLPRPFLYTYTHPPTPTHTHSFKQYIDTTFAEKMVLLTDVVSASAATGSPLDLHDLMFRFTLDSFGQIGFGVDPGCLRTPDKVPFAAAFDSAQVVSGVEGAPWV